jgi:dihydroneopterin aldolase
VQHDNLSEAVDYKKVYSTFIEISESRKYHLIETLAMHIVDELFSRFDSVTKIILRVRKNNPPIGGVVDSVEVEVMKTRAEFEAEIRS